MKPPRRKAVRVTLPMNPDALASGRADAAEWAKAIREIESARAGPIAELNIAIRRDGTAEPLTPLPPAFAREVVRQYRPGKAATAKAARNRARRQQAAEYARAERAKKRAPSEPQYRAIRALADRLPTDSARQLRERALSNQTLRENIVGRRGAQRSEVPSLRTFQRALKGHHRPK